MLKTNSGNKTTLIVLLCVFALVIILASSAHADAPPFQSYTQRDGLADDYITSIAFGSDGAAWIGTARGATRVQDKYWVTYTSDNWLGNSWVSGIAAGSDGKVYFATNGGGLAIFDGATRKTLKYLQLDHPQQLPHRRRARQAKPSVGRHVRRGRRAARG